MTKKQSGCFFLEHGVFVADYIRATQLMLVWSASQLHNMSVIRRH